MRSVFVCFFLNYSELRKCSFIPFSQWTKGYISVCPLLRPFFFLNWLHSLALSSYDITYIFCPAWFSLSSFWSFFSLGNLCQNLLDFLTSLISFKLVLSKHLALDTPIHAFKARCTDLSLGLKCETALGLRFSSSQPWFKASPANPICWKREWR